LRKQILPNEVLLRKKEAFSDGVSSQQRSLYVILQERIAETLNNNIHEGEDKIYIANIDTEKYYYKKIFTDLYPNCESILPYYWMPKYIESDDPSARTLATYN
jgi:asparagine synthase (glutamine-hydrolysing)